MFKMSLLFTVVLFITTVLQTFTTIQAYPDGELISCDPLAASLGHGQSSGSLALGNTVFKIDEEVYDTELPILLPASTTVKIAIENSNTVGVLFHLQPAIVEGGQDVTNSLTPDGDLLKIMGTCTAPEVAVVHNSNAIKSSASVFFDTTGLSGDFTLTISILFTQSTWLSGAISITISAEETATPTGQPSKSPVAATSDPTIRPTLEPTPVPTSGAPVEGSDPTASPTSPSPVTESVPTVSPTSEAPIEESVPTVSPTSPAPVEGFVPTIAPTSEAPIEESVPTVSPTSEAPIEEFVPTVSPTSEAPVEESVPTVAPTSEAPVEGSDPTVSPTSPAPVEESVPTVAPTSEAPVEGSDPTVSPTSPAPVAESDPTPVPSTAQPTLGSQSVSTLAFVVSYSAPNATEPSDDEYAEAFGFTLSFLYSKFSNYYNSAETRRKLVSVTATPKFVNLIDLTGVLDAKQFYPDESFNIALFFGYVELIFSGDTDPLPDVDEVTTLLVGFLEDDYVELLVDFFDNTNPFGLTQLVAVETAKLEPTMSPLTRRSPRKAPRRNGNRKKN